MSTPSAPSPVVLLPGAGGTMRDVSVFKSSPLDRIEAIHYPGWRRYLADDFSAERLIAELSSDIERLLPTGPIRIVGISIGGHFGYAVALRLLAAGRTVSGFCAIDSFMIASDAPRSDWKGRALKQGVDLLREGRFSDFAQFARSKFWRAGLRLAPSLFTRLAASPKASTLLTLDPILEAEFSMRLLLKETAPFVAALDSQPVALDAPAVLIRTRPTASDDVAWQHRCPTMKVYEIPGQHHNLFEPPYIGTLHEVFMDATRDWH